MTQPVHPKVKWAAIAAFFAPLAAAAVVSGADAIAQHPEALNGVPLLVKLLVLAAVSSAGAFAAGYLRESPAERYIPRPKTAATAPSMAQVRALTGETQTGGSTTPPAA